MKRANFIGAPQFFELNQACEILWRAFGDGSGIYLVGSSIKRRNFRDVDVRCIMDDDDFERLFGKHETAFYLNPLWSVMCCSVSLWLSKRTGLPIDFQIQKQSDANKNECGPRHALGLALPMPGGRNG